MPTGWVASRNALLTLAALLGSEVGCSRPTGVLIVLSNRDLAGDGGTATFTVNPAEQNVSAYSGPVRGTVRLRVTPEHVAFELVVTIQTTDGSPTIVCTFEVDPQRTEIDIDLANLPPECQTASPDAGGAEGGPPSDCERYCAAVGATCATDYANGDDCLALCSAYGWALGQAGDRGGNTLECRLTYATMAGGATGDSRTQFCLDASASGGFDCGGKCDNYCEAVGRNCPALLAGQPVDACKRSQACFDTPSAMETPIAEGNTLDCRIYWAGRAAREQDLCPQAALMPPRGGPCNP